MVSPFQILSKFRSPRNSNLINQDEPSLTRLSGQIISPLKRPKIWSHPTCLESINSTIAPRSFFWNAFRRRVKACWEKSPWFAKPQFKAILMGGAWGVHVPNCGRFLSIPRFPTIDDDLWEIHKILPTVAQQRIRSPRKRWRGFNE